MKGKGLPKLFLASNSPRRSQLLRENGYAFEVVPPIYDEPSLPERSARPAHLVQALSYFKGATLLGVVEAGLVLAADTIACKGEAVFGKPRDRAHAEKILTEIMGTTHEVLTGVTLIDAATGRRNIQFDRTLITMRTMSALELSSYLESGAWEGKAGAYGIQDHGDAFVEAIEGSFSNVVGLPMERLKEMLESWAAA